MPRGKYMTDVNKAASDTLKAAKTLAMKHFEGATFEGNEARPVIVGIAILLALLSRGEKRRKKKTTDLQSPKPPAPAPKRLDPVEEARKNPRTPRLPLSAIGTGRPAPAASQPAKPKPKKSPPKAAVQPRSARPRKRATSR